MRISKLRQLALLLHTTPSSATRAYVQEQLRELGTDISEFYSEFSMIQPDVDCFRYEGPAIPPMLVHNHPFYEILYCQTNCGLECSLGAHRFQLQRGDVLIIPPHIKHAVGIQGQNQDAFKGIFLWISKNYADALKQKHAFLQEYTFSNAVMIRTASTVWEHLESYFFHAVEETELQAPGWDSIVSGITTVLLTQLVRASADSSLPALVAEEPDLIDSILAYIERFLSSKISLEETASRFFVSQSTITHLFNKRLGVSFYKYITQRRLLEAQNLMREGMLLEKIAPKVGFEEYSTFYRAFKKEFGISPRQYAKTLQVKSTPL